MLHPVNRSAVYPVQRLLGTRRALYRTLGSHVLNNGSSASACKVPCDGRAAIKDPRHLWSVEDALQLSFLPAPAAACPPSYRGGAPCGSREGERANRSRSARRKCGSRAAQFAICMRPEDGFGTQPDPKPAGLTLCANIATITTSHHFDERLPLRPALGFPVSAALLPSHDQGLGFTVGRLTATSVLPKCSRFSERGTYNHSWSPTFIHQVHPVLRSCRCLAERMNQYYGLKGFTKML